MKDINSNKRISNIMVLVGLLGLGGCATTSTSDSDLEVELQEVRNSLTQLEASLDTRFSQICAAQSTDAANKISKLEKDLKRSRSRFSTLKQKCDATTFSQKLVLGEVEQVLLLDEDLKMSARIDTGAETSSLGVFKLQEFERDGKQWVRFKLVNKKSAPSYEYRVRGRVSIKQGAETAGEQRLEIRMNLRLGEKDYPRQVFNLADRSYLEHQVLIGRSFLTDVAIVDTSAKFLLKKR